MYGIKLTLILAVAFGLVVGVLSYFFYFKKTNTPNPIKKAGILAAIVAALTILIGVVTE